PVGQPLPPLRVEGGDARGTAPAVPRRARRLVPRRCRCGARPAGPAAQPHPARLRDRGPAPDDDHDPPERSRLPADAPAVLVRRRRRERGAVALARGHRAGLPGGLVRPRPRSPPRLPHDHGRRARRRPLVERVERRRAGRARRAPGPLLPAWHGGGEGARRRRVTPATQIASACLGATGSRTFQAMDPTYPAHVEAFRQRVRRFLEERLPPGWQGIGRLGPDEAREFAARWRAELAAHGFLAPSWPKEYGGPGLSEIEQVVLFQELQAAGVPTGTQNDAFSIGMVGNTILRHGTEAQKRHFLPRILSGE